MSNLLNLDISGFEMNNVTNAGAFLYATDRILNLKTPKIYSSNISIGLNKTMYDSNGNAYTTLDSTSPTETWLYSEPQ